MPLYQGLFSVPILKVITPLLMQPSTSSSCQASSHNFKRRFTGADQEKNHVLHKLFQRWRARVPVMTCCSTFLMAPLHMSFSHVGILVFQPSQPPRPQKADVRAMLGKPLLSLPLLPLSNCFVEYKLFRLMRNESPFLQYLFLSVSFCSQWNSQGIEKPQKPAIFWFGFLAFPSLMSQLSAIFLIWFSLLIVYARVTELKKKKI